MEKEVSHREEKEMERNSRKLFSSLCFLLLSLFCSTLTTAVSGLRDPNSCNGSIAECVEDLEVLMDSEVNRRFLEQKRYISTGALKRDQPVCNGGNGQPYSRSEACLPPQSHPCERGCSTYYRCRT